MHVPFSVLWGGFAVLKMFLDSVSDSLTEGIIDGCHQEEQICSSVIAVQPPRGTATAYSNALQVEISHEPRCMPL
jgi:hypothetical protein